MAKRSEERKQFLHDVFVTAIEGGINYWATVEDYHWTNGDEDSLDRKDIDGFYATVYEMADEDGEGSPSGRAVRWCPYYVNGELLRIDANVIARGIRLFIDEVKGEGGGEKLPYDHYWWQFVEANDTNGRDGDYDAIVAEQVVQYGLFGKAIYG